ncbi:MAG: 4-hydroxythreonine-4-phosphate dehydrogenase PdxA [Nitrospira sp.]|nr:4-hydroxythreonine-4-phosphate dehydrogenase PdxA [Nitrospira sp.]
MVKVGQLKRKPILALTMGDPAGIGPEVIAKVMAGPEIHRLCRPLIIGSQAVMERTVRTLRLPLQAVRVEGHELRGRRDKLPILDPLVHPLGRFQVGRVSQSCGAASVAFITKAVRLAEAGCVDAIVTGPINKEAINKAGFDYPGHTELLADLTRSREVGMMILGGPLKIMFVTTHVAIHDLPEALNTARVGKAIRLADRALREYFGLAKPRIGVAALNPHAGEGGLFGDEEGRVILPAARRARAAGILASDPLPADTLFGKAVRGDYDGIVAMYHDQGLIPLKLVAFGRCVNLTVGLPIIRTSVDHGTAFDIAGKGVADPGSLIEAVKLAARLAALRR